MEFYVLLGLGGLPQGIVRRENISDALESFTEFVNDHETTDLTTSIHNECLAEFTLEKPLAGDALGTRRRLFYTVCKVNELT